MAHISMVLVVMVNIVIIRGKILYLLRFRHFTSKSKNRFPPQVSSFYLRRFKSFTSRSKISFLLQVSFIYLWKFSFFTFRSKTAFLFEVKIFYFSGSVRFSLLNVGK